MKKHESTGHDTSPGLALLLLLRRLLHRTLLWIVVFTSIDCNSSISTEVSIRRSSVRRMRRVVSWGQEYITTKAHLHSLDHYILPVSSTLHQNVGGTHWAVLVTERYREPFSARSHPRGTALALRSSTCGGPTPP